MKTAMEKLATIDAQFPELRGNCYAIGRGKASTPKAAVARAFGDLMKQKNVKGKRVHMIKTTITIVDVQKEVDGGAQNSEATTGKTPAILHRSKGRKAAASTRKRRS